MSEQPTPAEIRHQIGLATITLSTGVGIALGQWCGLGDWAKWSPEFRQLAGQRALEQLDEALAELTTWRSHLAAALPATQDSEATGE